MGSKREEEIARLNVGLGIEGQPLSKELANTKKEVYNLSKSFDVASKSVDTASDKTEALETAIERGQKAISKMTKQVELQEKAYKDLYTRTEKQKQKHDELKQEYEKAQTSLNELSKTTKKNSDEYKTQAKVVNDLKKQLNEKAEIIQKNSNKLNKYNIDIEKTNANIKKLEQSMDSLNSPTDEKTGFDFSKIDIGSFIQDVTDGATGLDLLSLSAKGAALAIASLFAKEVLAGAIEFDSAILDLQLSLGATRKEAEDLVKEINNIASDGGYSVEGVSEAVKLLEQRFNLSSDETRELSQSMDLLAKKGYESADVTRFMTSAVNDWGLSHEQALDMIIYGEQKGLNISKDWIDTLVEYTPIISTLGVSAEDAFNLVETAVNSTSLSTDQAMDMVKEFFLTLTDGSTTSKDAFHDLGLDIDSMKNQIDSGSITAVDAMRKVMKAISNVSDETEQARILQEIFKGTIEYGSIGIIDAWANAEASVDSYTGAMDKATEAYEGSYEAMTQDLSNEWNELKQTIGSAVLPSLIKVMDFVGKSIKSINLIPFATSATFTKMGNDIGNAFDGTLAKIEQGVIFVGKKISDFARSIGKDDWADSLDKRVQDVEKSYFGLVDNIRERNKENEKLNEEHSKRLEEIWGNTKLEPQIDTEKVQQEINKLNDALNTFRETGDTKLLIELEGEDKAKLYSEIVKKLPTNSEFTNKFIIDNKDALSKMKSWEEVQKWLNKQPKEFKQKYGLEVTGSEKTKKEIEEIDKQYEKIPKEIKTVLKAEDTDSKSKAIELHSEYNKLPKEVKTLLDANNYKALEGAQTLQDALKNIPVEKRVSLLTNIQESGNMSPEQLQLILDSLPEEERVKVETSISGNENIEKTKQDIENLPKEAKANVTVETGDSKEKIQDVKQEINNVNGTTSKVTFHAETAQASKNVTGLKSNIADYDNKNTGKTKKTTFSTETAQASKNVTGLKNNIADFVRKYVKTFTTTFKVVTKYSTQGTPTSQSSNVNLNAPRSLDVAPNNINEPVPFSLNRTAPQNNKNENNTPNNPNTRMGGMPRISITGRNVKDSLKYNIDLLTELKNKIDTITNSISVLDSQLKRASGNDNIKFLEKQNKLYEQQLQLQEELGKKLNEQVIHYKNYLQSQGFIFDSAGNLKNYEEKLLLMEKEVDLLEERANKENASDSSKKAYESKKEHLAEIKKYLDAYIKTAFTELPNVAKEFLNINNAIKDNIDSIKDFQDALKDLQIDSGYKNHNRDLAEIKDLLDKNQILIDGATGSDKEALMQKRLELIKRYQKELQELVIYTKSLKNSLQVELGEYFTFRDDGSIVNYGNEIKKLKEILSEEDFKKVFDKVNEYFDLSLKKIPDLENEWLKLNNQIKEQINKVDKLKDELKELAEDSSYKNHERDLAEVNNALERNEILLKNAQGYEKSKLLEERIKLLKQLQKETQELTDFEKSRRQGLMSELNKYGLEFRDNGSIVNYGNVINELKKTLSDDEFTDVFEKVEEYLDLTNKKIPDLENEYLELGNTIKDVYKEQLELISDVEDKITEMIKAQTEERIELIEKELDKRLNALDKAKNAYNDARNEQKYSDSLNDQRKIVEDLQAEIEKAKRDDSISGQKRLQELLNKLKDEQKKLDEIVQDKLDENINNMFDKESERLENNAEETIKDLEDKFSDSKIAEMVAQALGSGVFTDIEGNVHSLEDALVNFAKESGDLFGVLGSTIKKELIDNLDAALNIYRNLDQIVNNMNSKSTFTFPNVDYSSARFIPSSQSNINNTNNSKNIQFIFNEPILHVNNVTKENLPLVKKYAGEAQETIINDIVKKLN